ncbi:glycosyltransferase family 25 protein [Algibacillus agarilyticus]|uniref:glycosyltransferase family 25 protein n=1 Tax=Algibacillus agarilyticus TaxID=2234133 RepID=UPI000DD04A73|nr:glycosyltransferase family 25 protein [Algibacillus agarilyticus]
MQYKIFIINLPSSTERLAQIKQQCDALGLRFDRVDAVRGSELPASEKARYYNPNVNKQKYDKQLNDGEIGCYLSHVSCWQQVVDNKLDFALILEDDAILTTNIPLFIQKIQTLTQNWDYIKLSHGSKTKTVKNTLALGDNLSLHTCLKLPSTTTGQFVSQSGAQKLLAHAFPIARPVDVDIQHWFEKSLKVFVVRPFPVLNGDFGSEINNVKARLSEPKRPFAKLWLKIKFESKLLLAQYRLPQLPTIQTKNNDSKD